MTLIAVLRFWVQEEPINANTLTIGCQFRVRCTLVTCFYVVTIKTVDTARFTFVIFSELVACALFA